MYSNVEFYLNPRLLFDSDDFEKILKFTNKKLDYNLKQNIIKDLTSTKFKKLFYEDIFNTGSNDVDDISQYLDGKILEIKYMNDSFRVKLSLFVSKKLPKPYSGLNKKELYPMDKILKLLTKKNIIEMIKDNINHNYRARGHYKDFKFNEYKIYLDLSLNSKNDKYVMNKFSIK